MVLKTIKKDFADNYLREIPLLIMVLGIVSVILNLSPVYSLFGKVRNPFNPAVLVSEIYAVSLVLFLAGELRKKHENTVRNAVIYVLVTLIIGFIAASLLNYLSPGVIFINPSTMPFYA